MGRNYERLGIVEFGEQLIRSGDLDPVYVALRNVDWPLEQKWKFCVAYWCLYDCGSAAFMSALCGKHFWSSLREAALNEEPSPIGQRWRRGSERRHWRGIQALTSMQDLEDRYRVTGLQAWFESYTKTDLTYESVTRVTKLHRGFGDWIAFKVADMLERVFNLPVKFEGAHVFMFKDPVKAAHMVWRQQMGFDAKDERVYSRSSETEVIQLVLAHLDLHLGHLKAPPSLDRPVGLQELETVLCKWKSHLNGHYPLLNDTHEITDSVRPWSAVSASALQFMEGMPNGTI